MASNNKQDDQKQQIYVLTGDDLPEAASVQSFKMVRVHRSRLLNAPYNPRIMSDQAKARLKEHLKEVGLTHPIEWNFSTGHITGGHQRINQIDSIMGTHDYWLDVAMVDFDEQTEKAHNIFLNNPAGQGDWDLEKLGKLFREDKVSIEKSGFSTSDIYQMFGDNVLVENQTPEQLTAIADRMRASWEQYETLSTETAKAKDPDFYIVAVFEDSGHRREFLDALNLPDNCYVDGRLLQGMLQK